MYQKMKYFRMLLYHWYLIHSSRQKDSALLVDCEAVPHCGVPECNNNHSFGIWTVAEPAWARCPSIQWNGCKQVSWSCRSWTGWSSEERFLREFLPPLFSLWVSKFCAILGRTLHVEKLFSCELWFYPHVSCFPAVKWQVAFRYRFLHSETIIKSLPSHNSLSMQSLDRVPSEARVTLEAAA